MCRMQLFVTLFIGRQQLGIVTGKLVFHVVGGLWIFTFMYLFILFLKVFFWVEKSILLTLIN